MKLGICDHTDNKEHYLISIDLLAVGSVANPHLTENF